MKPLKTLFIEPYLSSTPPPPNFIVNSRTGLLCALMLIALLFGVVGANAQTNVITYIIDSQGLPDDDGFTSLFALDVDGDGDMDVLSASFLGNTIVWYENDGGQSFTEHDITTSADGVISVFAIDVDGDGDMDVLSASFLGNTIVWYENDGGQSFTEHDITTSADDAFSVFALDVDGDGDMDVLSASSLDDTIAWYENDGGQSFTKHDITTSADDAFSVFALDVGGDGDMDVLSASYNDDTIAWYENDGGQSFTKHDITTSADGARSVFAIDVDGDGDIDVLSANSKDGGDTSYLAWHDLGFTNEPPTNIQLLSTSIDENAEDNTTVGTSLSTTDPNSGRNIFTYTLVEGDGDADNGSFNILKDELRLTASADFETKSSYSIRINVNDGANNFEKEFVISVNDINEAPSISDQAFSVVENAAIGTAVGRVIATDPDQTSPNNTLAYSITSGNTDVVFAINPINGEIMVTGTLDRQTTASYMLTVQVEDNGSESPLSATATITITVGMIATQTLTLAGGPQTIDVSANFDDADGEALTYTAMSQDESIVTVSIDASGMLTLTPVALGSTEITVTASDLAGVGETQNFQVTVTNALSTDNFNAKSINVFSTSNRTLRITGLNNEKAGVRLFDILGRLVLKTTVSPESEVKLPRGVKTGIYIVRINTLKESVNKKIILR